MKTKDVLIIILLGLTASIIISSLLYFGGSFSNASFDIKEWAKDSRDFIATFWVIMNFMAWIAIIMLSYDDK
jgi:hypothetical protein